MAEVTRVNGLKATVGALYNNNCNVFKSVVKVAAGTEVDLRAEDDAVNETVEQIVKELNPLAYYTDDSSSGIMYVVMDKAINSAIELRTRVRRIGKDTNATTTSIGPNDIDISGTTVTPVTSISGVVTLAGVVITGTSGQFSTTSPTLLEVGQTVTISGTAGGTGSITGYSNPTTYYIIATNESTTFTLSETLDGAAVVTTIGTPTGLTYTLT
jgi:hypothetical protein